MSVPFVRHFLVCGHVEFDLNERVAPYSLHNVAFTHRPPDGTTYPFSESELWLFVQFVGVGDHECWVELVRMPDDEEANEGESLALYGPFVIHLGLEQASLPRGWHIRGVPFPAAGWYEFHLQSQGETLATEPIYLED